MIQERTNVRKRRSACFCWKQTGGVIGFEEEKMSVKRIVLNLSSEEILRLTKILLDEEKDEALTFLKEVLKPQVDQATREQ